MVWLSSQQALAIFPVRIQTLYANVSRGRIRTRVDPHDPRRSQYHADDVRRLAGRHAGRRSASAMAADAVAYGDPILSSSVSTIADGRLWYRGRDAVQMSQSATLEQVTELLWQTPRVRFSHLPAETARRGSRAPPLTAALTTLAARVATDLPCQGRARAVLILEAQDLVGAMASAMLGGTASAATPLHRRLALAWRKPRAADVLRRALVLLADHELNASAFATRVAISTGTPLSAGLMAGLATLAGPLHGGASLAARSLMAAARQHGAAEAIREYLAGGQPLPAFGHPLYPDGDPRAAALLNSIAPRAEFLTVMSAAESLTGERPNIDFALCALADGYSLPAEATFVIFALARSVGWIAQALEQVESGQLIRPRARYTGPALPIATPRDA